MVKVAGSLAAASGEGSRQGAFRFARAVMAHVERLEGFQTCLLELSVARRVLALRLHESHRCGGCDGGDGASALGELIRSGAQPFVDATDGIVVDRSICARDRLANVRRDGPVKECVAFN